MIAWNYGDTTTTTIVRQSVTTAGTTTWDDPFFDVTPFIEVMKRLPTPKNWRWFHVFRGRSSADRARPELGGRGIDLHRPLHQMFNLVEAARRKRKLWLAALRSTVMT